jgi:hypothetical protein
VGRTEPIFRIDVMVAYFVANELERVRFPYAGRKVLGMLIA